MPFAEAGIQPLPPLPPVLTVLSISSVLVRSAQREVGVPV